MFELEERTGPHCADVEDSGSEEGGQLATINATIAGDMIFLYQAALTMLENPTWMTNPDMPLPTRIVTSRLRKVTHVVHPPKSKKEEEKEV